MTGEPMQQIKVELQEWMGSDRSIADSAWTSSTDLIKKEARTEEDVSRIVNMLADLKHSVPFESVVFKFWIRLPIAIDRQHMTHRIASHSGMSGRYRTMPDDFLGVPDDIFTILDKYKEPGMDVDTQYYTLCYGANKWYTSNCKIAKNAKEEGKISNAEYKRVREFMRGVLPQHNMTERVTVMNLRSFANYYKLRSKADAQPEIQAIANLMFDAIIEKNICPVAISALDNNDWII
jgi:flavin-dependent thymidylate synthase